MFILVNYNEDDGINRAGMFDSKKEAMQQIADDVYTLYDIDIDMNDYPFDGSNAIYEYYPSETEDSQYAHVGIDNYGDMFVSIFDGLYDNNQQWLIIEAK